MIKISRTGVEQYMKCPRCFVLQSLYLGSDIADKYYKKLLDEQNN